ncbi:hypothetical protein PC122_g18517 [Phytophthora cactorum]|nr:hypothetical protein PC122_g18517 [Phytophthora cactorum]
MLNPIEGCFSVFKAKTIFAKNQQAKGIDFKSAIEFYDALTVVNYVQTHRVLNDLVLLNKDNSSLLHLGAALSASPNPLIKGAAGNTIHGPGSVEKLAERITVCQLLLSAGNDPVFVREGGSVEKILKATKDIGSHCEVVDSLTGFMDG